ncbi:DMT family transporter [Aureispira anguillae]|uniref:DMT family transporter n=1 Tax=Aureispira anguillae TaxID=2864201 RepID=A0A916DUL0_9BACT|nr:DMT family transporter [Aureispira anguillae]BDS13461.1 DMT family transporter [Aureispira anguillae]
MKNKLILAHIAMFLVALIYAANFTIAKPVMAGENPYVAPFGFIMMRVLAATTLLWLTHLLFVRERIERKDILRLALCGVCGVAGNQLSFFYGLNLTTPINGALIMLTTPILVLILSMFVFGEKLTAAKGSGIALGLTGAALLILNNRGDIPNAPNPMLGNIYIAINAAFYAVYLVLVKPLMSKYSPITTLKWVFLFGTIYVLPFGWAPMQAVDYQTMPSHIMWSIFFVLFFVTYLAYLMNGAALAIVKPSVSSAYIYLQPLLASIIAVGAGKDKITMVMIGAGCLIFTGVFLVSKRSKVTPALEEE